MTLPPLSDFPALIGAAASVVGESDLTDVLTKTVETAMQLTGAQYGALGVVGEHGTLIEFLHRGMDRGNRRQGRARSPPEKAFSGRS